MEILHENKTNNSRIVKDWDGDRIFEIQPPNRFIEKISFNINYLPESSHEWFCHIVGNHFKHSMVEAAKFAQEELQYQFKTLMGIKL